MQSSSSSRARLPGPPQPSSLYPQLPPAQNQQQVASTSKQSNETAPPQQQQQQAAPPSPEDPVYDPLQRASKVISEQLQRDQSLVGELADGLQGTSSGAYTVPPTPNFAPFVRTRSYNIPDGLFAEMETQTLEMKMGLFPDIDRAWMTIDNKLLLWNYKESSDFSRYDEQSEVILSVGLVRAKPGVFISTISHLLVLCTPSTLILLGLSVGNDITLYATDLSIPTDGIAMTDVVSMPDGRTFMVGSDGCLYEMQYRADEGWFTKRCALINWTGAGSGLPLLGSLVPEFLKSKTEDPIIGLTLDPTRSVIYALTRSNAIILYLVGSDGTSLTQVARAGDINRTALMLAPGAQAMLEPRSSVIRSVSPIGRGEGEGGAQMVAVTARGVRLYFSYHRRGYGGMRTTGGPPTALELMHVRLPPSNLTIDAPCAMPLSNGNSTNSGQQQSSQSSAPSVRFTSLTDHILCVGGVLIGAQQTPVDNVDVFLLACPDLGRLSQPVSSNQNQNQIQIQNGQQQQQVNPYNSTPVNSTPAPSRPALIEQALALPIAGRTWDIAEIPHVLTSLPAPPSLKVPGRGDLRLNELSAQMGVTQRRFLVLTNEAIHEITKQRPVDVLKAVLDAGAAGGREQEVVAFFDSYGRDQSCAMCLALASAPEPSSSSGGGVSSVIPGPVSADSIAGAKRLFYEFGGKPVKVDRGYGHPGVVSGQSSSQIFFSGRHEGLAIYFARLVRPIWTAKITVIAPTPTNPKRQISNVAERTLVSVQRDLTSLKTFIDRNSQLFTTGPVSEYSSDRSNDAEAWRAEQASLTSLVSLVTQTIEALSFVLLLIDYKLPETIEKCSPDLQSSFGGLTYQDLLTTKGGRDVARSVVNAIIHQQIGQQISIDTISEVLQQRCGSFCRADDVILFKAMEGMRRANETRDPSERRDCLQESLRLFVKGTSNLSLDKLKQTCSEYLNLHFPMGAIELPLKCAQDWDPEESAFGYWRDGEHEHDPRRSAFERRKECYAIVFSTLLAFDEMLDDEAAGRSRSNGSGEDADTLRANAYNQALSSEDPLFHASLYDWLISRHMTDQLLEIRTPFIESYLSRVPLSHARAELLWQFQVRNGRNAQAAVVQANLAQSFDLQLPLPQRLEYLTLAVSNAKSSGSSRSTGQSVEFLTDLEEKLEVAQVQLEVARTVHESEEMTPELKTELLARLNERLLTISELYLDFAEPYELLEITLQILHTSDHRDPALVSATWRAILERTHAEADGDKPDAVAAVVVALGRRFFPSETAFPLEFVCRRLEEYSYANRRDSRVGWVPATLRQAGAEWERIFEVFYVIFEEKMPPWETETAINFLVTDLVSLLKDWFAEWTRAQSSYSQRPSTRFPVLQVEEFITNSLLPHFVSADEADPRLATLRGLQRSMRSNM